MIRSFNSISDPASATERIVFVIDDDLATRETLDSLFRSIGLRVELFGSARELAMSGCLMLPAASSWISDCLGSAASIFKPNWLRKISAPRSSL